MQKLKLMTLIVLYAEEGGEIPMLSVTSNFIIVPEVIIINFISALSFYFILH